MRNSEIFDKAFLTKLTDKLTDMCGDGGAVSTAGVCKELGVDDSLKSAVGAIVSLDIVNGFELTRGRGITMKGDKKRVKKAVAPTVSQPTNTDVDSSDDFAALMRVTLRDLCEATDRPIPVPELATAMGETGYKAKKRISELIKSPDFTSEFEVRRGRNGGIRRLDVTQGEEVSAQPAEETVVEKVEEAEETVALQSAEEQQASSGLTDEEMESMVEAIMNDEPMELEASVSDSDASSQAAAMLEDVELSEE